VTIAMIALSGSLLSLSEYGPVLSRLQPILTSPVEGALVGAHPGPLQGRISASHVTFGYDARHSPLFRDLSFDISPGEFVAFVGPSGGGKSTVLRLLLGFEEPWSGSIAYDGRDLSMLDVAAVRRQIGVVLQSSRPLGRTVLECVAGPRELSPERVQRLLEEAGLADDVAAMRDGIHTDIGEHGSRLSGGQRQRLMIAAALATDPSILFFDEATSALDNISQATVMDTILTSRATRVVIAHRLSTIERADRILVVSAGAIVEEGAPEDLLRAGGEFARLAARQEL
jgi:ABC-type bacteriocin/lantibiotic exporter with double-glycine peptidase domain